MPAACREACCGAAPRFTVSELFERGLRRSRATPLEIAGPVHVGPDRLSTSFSLDVSSGRVAEVRFRASSCATLIAYCEFIAEHAQGLAIDTADAGLGAAALVAAVPGVPALKRDRAVLAAAAFRAALRQAAGARE